MLIILKILTVSVVGCQEKHSEERNRLKSTKNVEVCQDEASGGSGSAFVQFRWKFYETPKKVSSKFLKILDRVES